MVSLLVSKCSNSQVAKWGLLALTRLGTLGELIGANRGGEPSQTFSAGSAQAQTSRRKADPVRPAPHETCSHDCLPACLSRRSSPEFDSRPRGGEGKEHRPAHASLRPLQRGDQGQTPQQRPCPFADPPACFVCRASQNEQCCFSSFFPFLPFSLRTRLKWKQRAQETATPNVVPMFFEDTRGSREI